MEEATTNKSGIPNRAKSARLLAKFLMIGMSLSETMEVASHRSSERLLTIEKGTHSNYKGNLYVMGSIPICAAINLHVSSIGRAKEYLVP